MAFVASCKECEWYFIQGNKEDITYFGKRHSKEFSHRIEFREEYEVDDDNAGESSEPEELLQDRDDEDRYFRGDFNSKDRFTS